MSIIHLQVVTLEHHIDSIDCLRNVCGIAIELPSYGYECQMWQIIHFF